LRPATGAVPGFGVEFPNSSRIGADQDLAASHGKSSGNLTGMRGGAEVLHVGPGVAEENLHVRDQGGVAMVGMLVVATFATFLAADWCLRRRWHRA
jgi:hypothetical protein